MFPILPLGAHTLTWQAKVTQIVEAAQLLEDKQLAPPRPLPAPASQELHLLPQCQQEDPWLGRGEQLTLGLAYTCVRAHTHTHTHVQQQGPAWHRGLPWPGGSRPIKAGPHPLLPARLQPPLHNYVWYFPVCPAWGEVVRGAVSTACTWASARGKPRQAAPTPRGQAGREGLGPAAQAPGRGQRQGSQTGTHTQQGLGTGPARQLGYSRGQAGPGTLPGLSRAHRGVVQCPTGHGWAPMAPPDT